MSNQLYNSLKEGGFVMAPYSLIRTLGATGTIILCELIAEYNYALKKGVNYNDSILVDLVRLRTIFCLDEPEVDLILAGLEEYELIRIYSTKIQNIKFITLDIENIKTFQKEALLGKYAGAWDNGLIESLNPPFGYSDGYRNSTVNIKNLIDILYSLEAVPTIYYELLNDEIIKYENNICTNAFDKLKIENFIRKNYKTYKAKELVDELTSIIRHIVNKYSEN